MNNGLKYLAGLLFTVTFCGNAAVIYQADDGSNIDLYGRLGFNVSDKKSGDTSGDFDGRIGFSARQAINEKLAVIGFTQYQVNAAEYANNISAEDPDDFTARYVWAGLDFAEWGKITAGRVSSGLIMFTDIGDVFASSDVAMARQANVIDPTAVQVFRQDGTIQYQNTAGNFDFSTAWILGNNSSDLDYGVNAAVRYTLDMSGAGKFQPVLAIQQSQASHDDTSVQSDDDADKYQMWGVGARYYLGDAMLGLLYAEDTVEYLDGRPDSTDKDYEATLVYSLTPEWWLRTGYRHLENTDGDGLSLRDTTLEVQYKATAKSSIYASYSWRNGEAGVNRVTNKRVSFGGSDPDDDYFHLGLRYEF
ncbi:porin [Enterobacteriaceae bacterium 155047]|uniref:porin n=1 Tax=Huaxiibacter chinensis TaxID=2899785 RepID=UPI0007DA6D03|nr:porin [Huaxiibacter chinensis]ANG92246.1 porin [Lelliottia amnigena]MCG5042939.1 porin [Huaxiibacter chinensis]